MVPPFAAHTPQKAGLSPRVQFKRNRRFLGSASAVSERSAGFNGVCTFIARNRAVSYLGRYDKKSPKEALGLFRSRIRRMWDHAAISLGATLSWISAASSLGLQSSAACATRAGGDSDLFHAQSPDTGRGLHARSRRAIRDDNIRR